MQHYRSARWLSTATAALALVACAVVAEARPALAAASVLTDTFDAYPLTRWRLELPAGTSVNIGRHYDGRTDPEKFAAEAKILSQAPAAVPVAPRAHLYRTLTPPESGRGWCELTMYLNLWSEVAAQVEVFVRPDAAITGPVLVQGAYQLDPPTAKKKWNVTQALHFPLREQITISIKIRVLNPQAAGPAELGTTVVIDDVTLACTEDPT